MILIREVMQSYCDILNVFAHRFALENFVLDKHVRYVLVIYPVVIWALTGNLDKNFDAESPNRNGFFIGKTPKRAPH